MRRPHASQQNCSRQQAIPQKEDTKEAKATLASSLRVPFGAQSVGIAMSTVSKALNHLAQKKFLTTSLEALRRMIFEDLCKEATSQQARTLMHSAFRQPPGVELSVGDFEARLAEISQIELRLGLQEITFERKFLLRSCLKGLMKTCVQALT